MSKICIFYHSVFVIEGKLLPAAGPIIREQMKALKDSGLLDAAEQLHVGINGSNESITIVHDMFPVKADIVFHGTECRNELRTLLMLEQFIKEHDDEWYVLYFHSKGVSHPVGHDLSTRWRSCMMRHAIHNWRLCIQALEEGFDAAGSHWMAPPETPPGQYIFAGGFWWAKSSFLKTLPSIMDRDRIKVSGIDALESRYEAEIILGNGPRVPKVKDFHGPNWDPSKWGTCST